MIADAMSYARRNSISGMCNTGDIDPYSERAVFLEQHRLCFLQYVHMLLFPPFLIFLINCLFDLYVCLFRACAALPQVTGLINGEGNVQDTSVFTVTGTNFFNSSLAVCRIGPLISKATPVVLVLLYVC